MKYIFIFSIVIFMGCKKDTTSKNIKTEPEKYNITYTDVTPDLVVESFGDSVLLDIDFDSSEDIKFISTNTRIIGPTPGSSYNLIRIDAVSINTDYNVFTNFSNILSPGDTIDQNSEWSTSAYLRGQGLWGGGLALTCCLDTGYLAIRKSEIEGGKFGWLKFRLPGMYNPTLEILEYALNQNHNQRIIVGKKGDD